MKKLNIEKWYFKNEEIKDAWQKDYKADEWKEVTVPHDWSVSQPFERNYSSGTGYLAGGIGWYRTTILKEQLGDVTDKIVKLHFEGVYKNARVWVNGYHLGQRPSGYASFYFDLTELANYSSDGEIVISVRVERQDLADSRWYNGMGINRPVTVEIRDRIYVDDYGTSFITPEVSEEEALIVIEHNLVNDYDESYHVLVRNELISDGQTSALVEEKLLVEGKANKNFKLESRLSNPKLWSPETPHVYELKTTLLYQTKNGESQESSYQTRVGIRSFDFHPDNGFFINGKPTELQGVCLHEDAGVLGTAVPGIVWARRLEKLKEMGANAIRMAHNPHSTVLYDLCDALGFFVIDEAFDEWENPKNKWWQGHNVYPPKLDGYANDFPQWFKRDLENMVLKNRNHPSIISWSVGNEIDYPNDPYANPLFEEMTGNNDHNKPKEERIYNPHRPNTTRLTTIANELISVVKDLDSSRPVTLAAAFPELTARTGLLDNLDVIGYNYKEFLYEKDHKTFPTKPLMGSENGHGYKEWLAVKDFAYISGQFLWTGIDYLGEASGWPVHGSPAGLLTVAGFEKDRFYLRKSWWSNEPVNHIVTLPDEEKITPYFWRMVSRKWDYPLNQNVQIHCYSNASDVELYVGDTFIEKMAYQSDEGYFVSIIPYEAKAIRTVALVGDKTIEDSLEPVYGAAKMAINTYELKEETVQKTKQILNERDARIYQLEVQIVDVKNQPTLDEVMVYLEVENGQLLGMENGDLSDTTSYTEQYRRTFDGKLICFVEKQNTSDICRVLFRAKSLPTEVISC